MNLMIANLHLCSTGQLHLQSTVGVPILLPCGATLYIQDQSASMSMASVASCILHLDLASNMACLISALLIFVPAYLSFS